MLNSIIQSRCLTKDQERSHEENDKGLNKSNKIKQLGEKDAYDDQNSLNESKNQRKESRKDARVRKSISSNKNKRSEKSMVKEKTGKDEPKNKMVEEEIDKPWISYLRNLRIPMM